MIPKKIVTRIHSLQKKIKKSSFLVPSMIAATLIGGFVLYLIVLDQSYAGKVYPNVSIDGKLVTGKTQDEIVNDYKPLEKKLSSVEISVLFEKQKIATLSGDQLHLKSNIHDIATQAYLIGRSKHFPSMVKEKFLVLTGLHQYSFKNTISYEKKPFQDYISETADAYNIPAKNALFTFENDKVSSFAPDEEGRKVDEKQFYSDIEKALDEIKKKPQNKTVTLKMIDVKPEITLSESNKFGIEELIGEGKSDYSGSNGDRIYNLSLAASKFHGVLIPPGEDFSFNQIVGDISSNTGYRPSYIIQNGKTVLGDGGGVCQVSTTAFRAALNTGLPIIERHAHAYRVGYYENDAKPGFDATIYTPNVDLKFKNDTPAYILVQTQIDRENNLLYFRFYGKKDNRHVELSDATVWDVAPPPPDKFEDDPNLPTGEVKQADYAAWGAKSKFSYKVTKDGKITFEEEFYSSYRPWQAVFLVGKG